MLLWSQTPSETVADLFAKKEYTKALTIIQSELKKSPNSKEFIELLGDAYGYQEQWDEAIESYEK